MVRVGVVALVLAALSLTACGSDYHYVSNRDQGAYFKVPDHWEVYGTGELLRSEDGWLTDDEVDERDDAIWLRGFDAAEEPSPEHVLDATAASPRGYAEVRALSASERDGFDYAELRRAGFPLHDPTSGEALDPLEVATSDPGGVVTVLEYDDEDPLGPLELGDGLRGVRIRTRIAVGDDEPVILEQISVVDADTTRHYSFTVGCRRRCWDENEDVIREIADSWTLKVQP
jgi:hypothetical protein